MSGNNVPKMLQEIETGKIQKGFFQDFFQGCF
jgi:hypothetical protein